MSFSDWGKQKECEAAEYFMESRAARLVGRNIRYRWGEIDLVFEERSLLGGTVLVFVEVKARRRGKALEAVGWSKRRRLRRAVDTFLQTYQGEANSLRVDVLAWESGGWIHAEDVELV